MWDSLKKDHVTQNLVDAGCDADMVNQFLTLMESGSYWEQMRLLDVHRKLLLESLHRVQKQIDCLDYLIYHLKRRHERKDV